MGGGMEVNKNKWIEDWNAGRENLEFNFRWTRRNLVLVGLFGVALPILVYKGVVREFHMQDEDAKRPLRKFLAKSSYHAGGKRRNGYNSSCEKGGGAPISWTSKLSKKE